MNYLLDSIFDQAPKCRRARKKSFETEYNVKWDGIGRYPASANKLYCRNPVVLLDGTYLPSGIVDVKNYFRGNIARVIAENAMKARPAAPVGNHYPRGDISKRLLKNTQPVVIRRSETRQRSRFGRRRICKFDLDHKQVLRFAQDDRANWFFNNLLKGFDLPGFLKWGFSK
jgi:hypothetical protein